MRRRWEFAVLVVVAALCLSVYAIASAGSGAKPLARTGQPIGAAPARAASLLRATLRAVRVRAATPPLGAASRLTAAVMRPRPGAVAPGTAVSSSDLFTQRVFATGRVGFAVANRGSAQYPVLTTDGGRTWRVDGPQVHVDAADGPEAVGYVGLAGPKAFFTYGSSVVDVTTDQGRTWWETYMGELVTAVVSAPDGSGLVAYVQQSVSNAHPLNPAVTRQYVSDDGGRHWSYSTALGGGVIP